MKKPRTHQTDKKAQRIFEDALPQTWVSNVQLDDYAKDYLVEVSDDDGELSGSSFYVQLKGQEQCRLTKDKQAISFRLEKKHTAYYAEKLKDLPIFLIVVDVGKKAVRYLFLQPALLNEPKLRTQSSVTLRIPVENEVSSTQFRQVVLDAKRWMQLNNPASLADAITFQKQKLVELDSRFEPQITVNKDGKTEMLLEANEPVKISLTINAKGAAAAEQLSSLGKGQLATFDAQCVKLTGSKIFETLPDDKLSLQICSERAATIELIAQDESGTSISNLPEFSGLLLGGLIEQRFEAQYFTSPLSVSVGPLQNGVGGAVNLTLNLKSWNGSSVLKLPYFDKLREFFVGIDKSASVKAVMRLDGQIVFSPSAPFHESPAICEMTSYIETIGKARRVADYFKIDPIWNFEAFTLEEQRTVNQVYGLAFEGGWSGPGPGLVLNTTFQRRGFRGDLLEKSDKPAALRLIGEPTFTILDAPIAPGRVTFELTHMTVKKPRIKLAKPKTQNADIPVTFKGTRDTVHSIRLATDEDK